MADRLLRFKVSTYIIVVFLPGSADSKIKQVIAVLILKTVTCVFVIIRSKFFRLLIPVINKPVGIVNPMLITVTKLKKMKPGQGFHVHQLQSVVIAVHLIFNPLILNILRVILKVMRSRKIRSIG